MTKAKNTSADRRSETIRHRAAKTAGRWYDQAAAERAVGFFHDCLVHVKGEWKGRPLDLAPWQADQIIRPLFGQKRGNVRRYRNLFCMVPRKSGKSTLAAGIALYLLFCDDEPSGEIYGAASDRMQAGIILDMCKAMVAASPALRSRAKVFARSIVVPSTGSSYRVVSSDAYSAHGFSPSGIIFDEVHTQPNRELFDALTTGQGARRQPLTVAITTAGYERESLCFQMYQHACDVRDGVIVDDSFLPAIYEAPRDSDWTAPATWRIAHPGIGISTTEEYIAAECEKARQLPAYENAFRRLLLDQWTEQSTRWISMAQWDLNEHPLPELEGRECHAGLDLSTTTDLSCLCLGFPDDKLVHLVPYFWAPAEQVRQRKLRGLVPYQTWVDQELLETTPGKSIDYAVIRKRINELAERVKIKSIVYDPWNAHDLTKQLTADGFNMVPLRQGFISLNAPTKEFERRLLAAELNHGGHPILRWMANSVTIKTDPAGNLKPDKESSADRIDGIVAAILALSAISTAPAEPRFQILFV